MLMAVLAAELHSPWAASSFVSYNRVWDSRAVRQTIRNPFSTWVARVFREFIGHWNISRSIKGRCMWAVQNLGFQNHQGSTNTIH